MVETIETTRKFSINFPKAISEFQNAMKKFPVKQILYKIIFRGKGLEFDSYRVFENGDDGDLIDWKASLRANQLLARKYIEEKELNVYFLVDVSNSMLFGSGNKLKAEYAAEFVAALSHLVSTSGDRIGLVMFNDKIVKFLHPGSGRNQFALFMKFLADPNLYGGGFNLGKTIESVLKTVRSDYNVFIVVSDFIKVNSFSDERSMKIIGTKFETISVVIRDVLDEELPKTDYQFAIQDPYSNRQMILDPKIAAERYRENVALQKRILMALFKKSKIDSVEFLTKNSFASLLVAFLKRRSKRGRI